MTLNKVVKHGIALNQNCCVKKILIPQGFNLGWYFFRLLILGDLMVL